MGKAGGPAWEERVFWRVSYFWGPPSVPDQTINVVLGPPLTGGDFKDVGSAEQQFLGVSVTTCRLGLKIKSHLVGLRA